MPEKAPREARKRTVSVDAPWPLYRAILMLSSEEMGFEEACMRATALLNMNSAIFKKAVEEEALRKAKSDFMIWFNRIGRKAYDKGYQDGYRDGTEHVRSSEANFRVHVAYAEGLLWMAPRKVLGAPAGKAGG